MLDAHDGDRVPPHGVDHDVRQRRHDEFARSLLLPESTAIRGTSAGCWVLRPALARDAPLGPVCARRGSPRSVRDPRLPLGSTGAPSATGLMVGQLLLEPGADGVARQYLPRVDLGEALLDFADEPVVVVDGSLDGFADQHVGRYASPVSRPRQPASRSGDRFTSMKASVLAGRGVSTGRKHRDERVEYPRDRSPVWALRSSFSTLNGPRQWSWEAAQPLTDRPRTKLADAPRYPCFSNAAAKTFGSEPSDTGQRSAASWLSRKPQHPRLTWCTASSSARTRRRRLPTPASSPPQCRRCLAARARGADRWTPVSRIRRGDRL